MVHKGKTATMNAITLHALDEPLAKRLRITAEREGKSLNQTAKGLLAAALGLASAPRRRVRNGLGRFCGTLADEDANRIRATLRDFDRIDE